MTVPEPALGLASTFCGRVGKGVRQGERADVGPRKSQGRSLSQQTALGVGKPGFFMSPKSKCQETLGESRPVSRAQALSKHRMRAWTLHFSPTGSYFLPKCMDSFVTVSRNSLQGIGHSGEVGPELLLCFTRLALGT